MAPTGKIAIVSLFLPTDQRRESSEELMWQIRRKIEASSLSDDWVIERITVLNEDGSAVKGLTPQRTKRIAVA